jgi:hypothetical protein
MLYVAPEDERTDYVRPNFVHNYESILISFVVTATNG